MKRFTLAIGSGALGLALFAGTLSAISAAPGPRPPRDWVPCYYHGYYCSYEGDNYWSDCDPSYPEGWIETSMAKQICGAYHES